MYLTVLLIYLILTIQLMLINVNDIEYTNYAEISSIIKSIKWGKL